MSLFGSLFSGVSGLAAQRQAMATISENVANVNTTAYKRASAEFSTLVTRAATASILSPGGVRPHTMYSIGQQGLVQASESPTDVAISGNGFFVVNSQADGSGEQLYTRAGSFTPDFLGNLRTTSGFFVQRWALDANGEIVDLNTLQTVNVRIINGLAAATTRVEVGAYRAALDVCDRPMPEDPYSAKFSLQHCVAVALRDGEVGPDSFDAAARQRMAETRAKVSLALSGEIDGAYPGAWGAQVRVATADGLSCWSI
jgi:flagellar hook protein FlgE